MGYRSVLEGGPQSLRSAVGSSLSTAEHVPTNFNRSVYTKSLTLPRPQHCSNLPHRLKLFNQSSISSALFDLMNGVGLHLLRNCSRTWPPWRHAFQAAADAVARR